MHVSSGVGKGKTESIWSSDRIFYHFVLQSRASRLSTELPIHSLTKLLPFLWPVNRFKAGKILCGTMLLFVATLLLSHFLGIVNKVRAQTCIMSLLF